jgi:hypothetical protein
VRPPFETPRDGWIATHKMKVVEAMEELIILIMLPISWGGFLRKIVHSWFLMVPRKHLQAAFACRFLMVISKHWLNTIVDQYGLKRRRCQIGSFIMDYSNRSQVSCQPTIFEMRDDLFDGRVINVNYLPESSR